MNKTVNNKAFNVLFLTLSQTINF